MQALGKLAAPLRLSLASSSLDGYDCSLRSAVQERLSNERLTPSAFPLVRLFVRRSISVARHRNFASTPHHLHLRLFDGLILLARATSLRRMIAAVGTTMSMITGLHTTWCQVSDMDRSVAFYRE